MATYDSIPVAHSSPLPGVPELLGLAAANVLTAAVLSLPAALRGAAWRLALEGIGRLPGGGWAAVLLPRDLFDSAEVRPCDE